MSPWQLKLVTATPAVSRKSLEPSFCLPPPHLDLFCWCWEFVLSSLCFSNWAISTDQILLCLRLLPACFSLGAYICRGSVSMGLKEQWGKKIKGLITFLQSVLVWSFSFFSFLCLSCLFFFKNLQCCLKSIDMKGYWNINMDSNPESCSLKQNKQTNKKNPTNT